MSFAGLSTQEDYSTVEKFFKVRLMFDATVDPHCLQDKDTSRFNMALAQALESIQTRISYIEVCLPLTYSGGLTGDAKFQRSKDDLTEWLAQWEQSQSH